MAKKKKLSVAEARKRSIRQARRSKRKAEVLYQPSLPSFEPVDKLPF